MCVLNSGDVLLAIRQRADPRLAIRSNETLKRVSNVGRLGEIPRRIAKAEKDEGPSHPDTFLSCRSYVNPRCFFAALLIIDHLITIHYTFPILPTLPLRSCFSVLSEGIIPAPREVASEQIEREKKRRWEAAGERGKLFLSAAPGDGRPFAYRPPYRQTHRGRPS